MYNEEYYNKVLKRGFIVREDLDREERKGVLDTTLLKLKDGIPECLKYTFNMDKLPVYKYSAFYLASNIFEQLICLCRAILEKEGIVTVYDRGDLIDKMQTKSPCERDSSWVLRELKVLIGLHREYKELGGIINYLNQFRVLRNYITHSIDIPLEDLVIIEQDYKNIILKKEGSIVVLIHCFNTLRKYVKVNTKEDYIKQKEFILATLAREKVNKVYNENVTYTRKLYETHKKQGFPVSLRNKMKEIEGEINGIEPMGSF